MAASPLLARWGLRVGSVGAAASLALALGTAVDAAARIGFYADATAGAEKIGTVVGGVTGPVHTRNGSTVDSSFPGAVTITSLTSGRVPFAGTAGLLGDSAALTFSVPSFAQLVVGSNAQAGSSFLTLNAAAGYAHAFLGQTAGVNRWQLAVGDGAAESGANAGSNFNLTAYTDAGGAIDSPLTIARAAGGTFAIARPVTVASTLGVAGTATITGAGGVVINPGTTQAKLALGSVANASGYATITLSPSSAKYGFQIGAQSNVNDTFEITPSTAAGGTTFSTPALTIAGATGAFAINTGTTNGFTFTNSTVVTYEKIVSTAAHATSNQVGLDLWMNNASAVSKEYGYLICQPNVGTAANEQTKWTLGGYDAGTQFNLLVFTGRDAAFIRDATINGKLTVIGNINAFGSSLRQDYGTGGATGGAANSIESNAVQSFWRTNYYYNGSNDVRARAGFATSFECSVSTGDISLRTAATGAADSNIAWTTGLGISAAGVVSVPGTLSVTGTATMAAINASGDIACTNNFITLTRSTAGGTFISAKNNDTTAATSVELQLIGTTTGGANRNGFRAFYTPNLASASSFLLQTGKVSGILFEGASTVLNQREGGPILVGVNDTEVARFNSAGISVTGTVLSTGSITVTGATRFVRVDHGGTEGNLFVGYFNSSNSQGGLFVGSSGEPYFGSNIDHPSSADNYFKGTIPPWRIGNGGGSTTIPVSIDVAVAGTAGNPITWLTALSIDTSRNATFNAAVTAAGDVLSSGGNVGSASYFKHSNSDANAVELTGSLNASGTFAGITVYGKSHASQANRIFYDGARHTIRSADGSTAYLTIDGTTVAAALPLTSTGAITSSGATNGIGYATGAGGTVTQATSKSTGVTLNKACGTITMNGAAHGAGGKVSFVLTNSAIAATDGVAVWVASGGTANAYRASVTAVAAGSCTITVENITGGSLSEAPVIGFAIVKAVTA